MKENRLTVTIGRPISEVFFFSINPENTKKWIPTMLEEISSDFPPQIGTKYKNRVEGGEWDEYIVSEYEDGKLFSLRDLMNNYNVRYTYKSISANITEMEYFEWNNAGTLSNPFSISNLNTLKSLLENKK